MLYFLHGTDTDKARAKALELVSVLQKKRPDAQLFKMGSDSWNAPAFEEFLGGQGLFERKFIVFGSRLFENKEAKEKVVEKLPLLASSENVFILFEGRVDKATVSGVAKFAERVQVFEKTEKKEFFNMFALADALGERDRKNLWVLYHKALRQDASGEELVGILFWQVKNMLVVREVNSAREAGLSPFSFQNSKRYSRNFKAGEVESLGNGLLSLYHDAHRGLVDIEVGLERFILSV